MKHSKDSFWSFFNKLEQIKLDESSAFITNDSTTQELIKKYLRSKRKYNVIFPQDVTSDWIEDNLKTLDLFGMQHFLFLETQELSATIKEELLASISESSHVSHYLTAQRTKKISSYTISTTAPWDWPKVLNSLCRLLRLQLSPGAKKYIVDSLAQEVGAYYYFLKKIEVFYPRKNLISEQDVYEILDNKSISGFDLLEHLKKREAEHFWSKLRYSYTSEGGKFFQTLGFLRSQLGRMLDYSYGEPLRDNPSGYERRLFAASNNLPRKYLQTLLTEMNQLLTDTRTKKDVELVFASKILQAKSQKITLAK